jgi:zinc-binding in reverse transcriptase
MNVLAVWIQKLNEHHILKPIYTGCRNCLIYVDDTLIFVKPTAHQLNLLKLLLDTFGNISGLKINMQNSELLVTSMTSHQVQQLANLIQCKSATFPLKYLGLPLSDKRIPRQYFKQLIDGIQDALPGWQAEYLSLAGKGVLVNAVLSAKTVYFMSLYLLPKWVIKAIDNIRRRFLWHGHKCDDKKPMCLINWGIMTMSKHNGGLGIRDLHVMNQSLLAKWMWQWFNQDRWWKEVTITEDEAYRLWENKHASLFWKSVAKIKFSFHRSIEFRVGNGKKTLFWEDCWLECPIKQLYPTLYNQSKQRDCTVEEVYRQGQWKLLFHADSIEIQHQIGQLTTRLIGIHLQNREDEVRWTRSVKFTASAYYRFIQNFPNINNSLSNLWLLRAPPRVLTFTWLMLQNAILTVDNLQKRGWQLANVCHMCYNAEETIPHLFIECQYIKEIRCYIHDMTQTHRFISTKYRAGQYHFILDTSQNEHWKRMEIITCFVIWRERCRRIFQEENKAPLTIVREILLEYQNWFGNNEQD